MLGKQVEKHIAKCPYSEARVFLVKCYDVVHVDIDDDVKMPRSTKKNITLSSASDDQRPINRFKNIAVMKAMKPVNSQPNFSLQP